MEKRILLLALLGAFFLSGCQSIPTVSAIRVGCKNFTEQLIMGEVIAQYLEHKGFPVERKFGFGSTEIIHGALIHGDIDLYIEYSGTAAELILKQPGVDIASISQLYLDRFQVKWFPPLGLNNSYVLVSKSVLPGVADSRIDTGGSTISHLSEVAGQLTAGLNAEFLERPDGYRLLQNVYGLKFKKTVNLDVGLLYLALDSGQVDIIGAFSTDGRLLQKGYTVWSDDRKALPQYYASIAVRMKSLEKFPDLESTLHNLDGAISDVTMRGLNAQVELNQHSPAAVAKEFLNTHPFPKSP